MANCPVAREIVHVKCGAATLQDSTNAIPQQTSCNLSSVISMQCDKEVDPETRRGSQMSSSGKGKKKHINIFQHKHLGRFGGQEGGLKGAIYGEKMFTVVAKRITELIRFEPEVCICKINYLEFKGESVSVMRDLLPTFLQICLCNGN